MNKPSKRYIFLIFILFSVQLTYGQEADSVYFLTGNVVSKSGNFPVAFAHVINLGQKWGVVADTMGYFEILVKPGDTLNVSAIGFNYRDYVVEGNLRDSLVVIFIQNRSYEIPEATIFYLGTYKDFEYKVLNLELPEPKINEGVRKIFKYDVDFVPYEVPRISSPVSLVYNLFSKNAKAMKKYADIKENEDAVTEINERYNVHIVKNLTGLAGDEVSEFMLFCNFQDSYILNVSDYKLYSEILSKFEEFKKNRNNVENRK